MITHAVSQNNKEIGRFTKEQIVAEVKAGRVSSAAWYYDDAKKDWLLVKDLLIVISMSPGGGRDGFTWKSAWKIANRTGGFIVAGLLIWVTTSSGGQYQAVMLLSKIGFVSASDSFLWRSANNGNPKAQYLAAVVAFGDDAKGHNYPESFRWYMKAAEQGNPEAQLAVGLMYIQGLGVSQSDTLAAKWTQLSADQGNATAQAMMSDLYYTGKGVEKNEAVAIELIQKAAAGGHANAQRTVGRLCIHGGPGISVNLIEGERWLRKAAEQGDQKAQDELNQFLAEGGSSPVAREQILAARAVRSASEQQRETMNRQEAVMDEQQQTADAIKAAIILRALSGQ